MGTATIDKESEVSLVNKPINAKSYRGGQNRKGIKAYMW